MASKFWNFKALDDNTGELTLYGEIANETWWGDEVTPKEFKADLDGLGEIDTLNIYINSPGGDVFAGQAIHSMLKRHIIKFKHIVNNNYLFVQSIYNNIILHMS
jgi:ATP-dependent Clp protease protease subunit